MKTESKQQLRDKIVGLELHNRAIQDRFKAEQDKAKYWQEKSNYQARLLSIFAIYAIALTVWAII